MAGKWSINSLFALALKLMRGHERKRHRLALILDLSGDHIVRFASAKITSYKKVVDLGFFCVQRRIPILVAP